MYACTPEVVQKEALVPFVIVSHSRLPPFTLDDPLFIQDLSSVLSGVTYYLSFFLPPMVSLLKAFSDSWAPISCRYLL